MRTAAGGSIITPKLIVFVLLFVAGFVPKIKSYLIKFTAKYPQCALCPSVEAVRTAVKPDCTVSLGYVFSDWFIPFKFSA